MLTVKRFIFNPIQENTYVVYNGKDACAIIDPGCYFDEERTALKEYIEQQGLTPKLLLNTHCHLDHIFGNKFVHETWHLPLWLHEKEQAVLEAAPQWGIDWGLPFENYRGELHFLTPGQSISLGGPPEDDLHILFLPGHSPGSLGFYNKTQGLLIGGDVLFREGIGRTDFPGGDYDILMQTIHEQLWPLPDDTIVYPGHFENTTIGWEKNHNPFIS